MNNSNSAPDREAAPRMAPAPKRPRGWVRWLVWLLIFGSGLVAGSGITLLAVRSGVLYAIHHPREMPARVAARLRSRLRLDEDQARRVEEILRERQAALEGIRRRTQPQVEAELERIEQQIAEALDTRQREKWHRSFSALRATWLPAMPPGEPDSSQ
jgi:hypothetical protein